MSFKRNIPFIAICMTLTAAAGGMAYLYKEQVGVLEPKGVWRDVDSPYYIIFNESTKTFTESTYNIPRPYSEVAGGIMLHDAAGVPYFVALEENFGSLTAVHLNGSTRVMREATKSEAANPTMYRWGSDVTTKCVAAYALKQRLDTPYYLRLYEDNNFVSILDGESVTGKYTTTSTGDILLLSEQGTRVDVLRTWDEGAVFGEITAFLEATPTKANAIQLSGYKLKGTVRDIALGTQYFFTEDGLCRRALDTGEEVEFMYHMAPTGLITMVDVSGSGVSDYLWYDVEDKRMFRYVLSNDDWFAYLNGDIVPDSFTVGGGN